MKSSFLSKLRRITLRPLIFMAICNLLIAFGCHVILYFSEGHQISKLLTTQLENVQSDFSSELYFGQQEALQKRSKSLLKFFEDENGITSVCIELLDSRPKGMGALNFGNCSDDIFSENFQLDLSLGPEKLGTLRASILRKTTLFSSISPVLLFSLILSFLITCLFNRKTSQEIEKHVVEPLIREREELLKDQIYSDVARQVAHDVRSPLSALSLVSKRIHQNPTDETSLIVQATQRIQGILDNLTADTKLSTQTFIENDLKTFVSPAIEEVLSEKRVQTHKKINFDFSQSGNTFDLFVNLPEKDLKTIVSNIIDNSIEAIENSGSIKISVKKEDKDFITLSIHDNGKGIPNSILAHVGEKGFSHGKDHIQGSGSGLGIFSAQKILAQFGGHLTITNNEPTGTRVSLSIRKTKKPAWLCSVLSLKDVKRIVVLDDDISIHKLWEFRLKSYLKGVSFHTFSNPHDLILNKSLLDEKTLFLCDYELGEKLPSGIEVIESLKLQKNSILVTNNFRDGCVQINAQRLSLKVLPKPLLHHVTITGSLLGPEEKPTDVFS